MFHDDLIELLSRDTPIHLESDLTNKGKHFLSMMQSYFRDYKPAVFYYNAEDYDQALTETAYEFFENKLLVLPHRLNIFIKCELSKPVVAFIVIDLNPNHIDYSQVTTNTDQHLWACLFINKDGSGAPNYTVIDAHTAKIYSHMIFSNRPDVTEEMRAANDLSVRENVFSFLMLLNSKYVEKRETQIAAKLNKKRGKKGKQPLISYINLNVKRYDSLSTGAGTTVKPHWRRGHVRTLQDGRKIPVKPCLVNFIGDDPSEVNPKVYKVVK